MYRLQIEPCSSDVGGEEKTASAGQQWESKSVMVVPEGSDPQDGLSNWQQIITGAILIGAVTIDMARRRK